jgi:hypothetical protein
MRRASSSTLALLAVAAAGVGASAARAQTAALPSPEHAVKAAFLYNFARFVEWPAAPVDCTARPLVIAVLGPDPFGPALERAVSERKTGHQPIHVQRLRRAADIEPCTVLFVSDSSSERLGDILAALQGRPVLVVGESPGFARRGGAIGFVVDGKRVRFETNRQAAAAAGLTLSSRLLAVASAVDGGAPARSGR